MEQKREPPAGSNPDSRSDFHRLRLLALVGAVAIILLGIFLPQPSRKSTSSNSAGQSLWSASSPAPGKNAETSLGFQRSGPVPQFTAEQIVAGKIAKFADNRSRILHAMAKRFNIQVPSDVEQFFEAAAAGNWPELTNRFQALQQQRRSGAEHLQTLWGPILETYGVVQETQSWPAQKLLDYGQAVLNSLQPGMVYVGGTDPGRFIPTLLNETSDGDRHIVLTQNAFADSTYLQYLSFLYGDQMTTLSQEDSQRAFQDYMDDATKRLAHDQQFPDELHQIRPGEDVHESNGHVEVSGQVAVMAINERLLTMFMDKNPSLTFALEESFPLKSTYAEAIPLGPIMQLRAPNEQNGFSPDTAAQVVQYWRDTAQDLASDTTITAGSEPLREYAKMATAQASLLADHNYSSQAEQAYEAATRIWPGSPEAVFQYVNLLVGQNRVADALPIVQNAVAANPDNQQFRDLLQNLKQMGRGGR
jgi:hypothetical protein